MTRYYVHSRESAGRELTDSFSVVRNDADTRNDTAAAATPSRGTVQFEFLAVHVRQILRMHRINNDEYDGGRDDPGNRGGTSFSDQSV